MTKIVIVEDDPMQVAIIENYMEAEGYSCEYVSLSKFSDLLELIKHNDHGISLVIMDLAMTGGKNGLEFLRENHDHINVPVMVFSGKQELMKKVEEYADCIVTKPFRRETFFPALEKMGITK